LALAGGDLPIDGQINMPINRSKYSFGKFKVDEEGKMAITEFKLVKKIKIAGKVFSLVDINLKTGRTHQIRVHLSYLGWPIAGDKIYGGVAVTGLERPFLHAYELAITQPKTGKRLIINAVLPHELEEIIKQDEN
jgi:23S rRNA pseudouridine1911/1915/1917 synthase